MVMVPRACGCSPSARGRTKAGSWNHAASADLLLALLIKLAGSSSSFFLLLSAALLDIHIRFCFPNLLIFFCFSLTLWRGSFLLLVSRDVSSFLLSSHFLASVLVSCLRCVHRWSVRSSSRVAFSASAVSVVWFVFGVAGIQYALAIRILVWEGILQSTVSSAYCLVRMAGCPLHSA